MIVYLYFLLIFTTISCGQNRQALRESIELAKSGRLKQVHNLFREAYIDPEHLFNKFINLNNRSIPLTQECIEDITPIYLYMNYKNESGVPGDFVSGPLLSMIDAMGKIPPGVFRGARIFWGFYPECKSIRYQFTNRQRLWEGEYSRAYYNLALKDGKDPNNCGDSATFLAWDFCLPKGCNNQDVLWLLQNELFVLPSTNSSPVCFVELIDDVPKKVDYRTILVSVFMGCVIGIGLLASLVDYFLIKPDMTIRKHTPVKILMSFSLYNNLREIFTVGSSKKSGQIGTLHCIRFFSICWVVQGHVLETAVTFSNNILDVYEIVSDLPTQLVANPFFSVDSFFFLSGLLLAFLWFKEYNKDKKKVIRPQAWGMFYLHRILRLSPPYYVMLLFWTFIYQNLFYNMPLWLTPGTMYSQDDGHCARYFWINMVYLNNYVEWKKQCYQVTWYLATDMQMFVFTPILLIPLAINKFLGLAIAGILFSISTFINIFTVYKHHYPPTTFVVGWKDPEMTDGSFQQYDLYMYTAPYIRCQVYIIGLLVGYFMQMNQRVRINKVLNLVLWALAFSALLFVVMCLYRYYEGHELSLFARAMYSAFSKPIWALGLSWIVVACYYGNGGPINQFMSWNIWVPLSRLSYCVYLIHFLVIYIVLGMTKAPIIFSSFTDIWLKLVLPIIFASFLLSAIWSAAFEVSFSKIEMLLLMPNRSTVKEKSKQLHNGWEIEAKTTEKL